jgi:hypothetical protein
MRGAKLNTYFLHGIALKIQRMTEGSINVTDQKPRSPGIEQTL